MTIRAIVSRPSDESEWGNIKPMVDDVLAEAAALEIPSHPPGHRHDQAPNVTGLKGAHLTTIILRTHLVPSLPQHCLAKTTVAAHKRILRQLTHLPLDLQRLPLDKALVEYFTRLLNERRWQWSTTVVKMATAHGALRLLPLYTDSMQPVYLKHSEIWMQALKAAGREARQQVPNQPTAATWAQVHKAIELEPERATRMALLIAWLTCGRGGDVLLLKKDCFEVKTDGLMIHFRRGKTVKTRGPYPVFTQLPPPEFKAQFDDLFKATPANEFIFKGVKGADLKIALRRAHPQLEQRSIRRGAIQTLAASGLADLELLHYSGHTNVVMLRRYLNFGKLSAEGQRLTAQARALVL